MKKIALSFALQILNTTLLAQTGQSSLYSSYAALGVYSNKFSDVFSASVNEASLARIKNFGSGIYSEKKFMLKELAYYQAIIALPSKHGGFSLSLNYSGTGMYSESHIGFGYGKKLSEKIDLGARINYNLIRITGYGNVGVLSVGIGALFHVTEQLHIGVHIDNPIGGKFGKQAAEKLPFIYKSGFGYEVNEKVLISTEIVKEENFPININVGLQYNLIEQFFMRAGLASATGQFFLAAGLRWDRLRIDVIGSFHQQLGMTPALVFIFGSTTDK